jgi:alpha-1,3-glucan synthase
MLQTNDFVNQNTQEFDPRHMYGVTNQDVFRWPAIKNGTHKNLLGLFITTILLPGIPTLMWGEEQATYVLENTASNYVFGRAPMTSSLAWQIHGCYSVGSEKYFEFPLEAALMGCHDDSVSLDHRDPSHPVRNVLKRMHELRNIYPALNDGFSLTKLSNKTMDTYLLGSNGTATEIGIWSVMRSRSLTQNFDGHGQGNQSVWLIYSNEHEKNDLKFDCGEDEGSLLAPFDVGTTVKNLFYPYEEAILETSSKSHYHEGSINPNGCLSTLTMPAWGFKAYVPKEKWVGAAPTITRFVPGHDFRIISPLQAELKDSVPIGLYFSETMSCQSVTNSIIFESNTDDDSNPIIDANSIKCGPYSETTSQGLVGSTQSQWVWSANLVNVASGVHNIVINNATDAYGKATGAVDRFMFRIGHMNNPMVFPSLANYSTTLLHNNSDGSLYISHNAAGATLFRYSIDWNSHFSDWIPYRGGNTSLTALNWTGTRDQAWSGDHVYVQYWSNLTGSSDHFQHGDLFQSVPRRFPHLFVQGPFNQYSYDNGLPGNMVQDQYGTWEFDLMTEWPTSFQLNEWGLNPDGQPDQTMILGDVDHDGILDRIPPGSLLTNIINVTQAPPFPHTAWTILVNDGTLQWTIIPVGNCWNQLVAFVLLAIIPILTAAGTIWIFIKSFYQIKFNQKGVVNKIPNQTAIQLPLRRRVKKDPGSISHVSNQTTVITNPLQADAGAPNRRRVLIATMEYDIEDWEIKIKIGGLGVMAQLMGKNLGHQDLIWVVPCVSGVDYPMDTPVNSIFIKVLDKKYEVQVQCHVLRNITYVLLDAPIFRKQSKSEPYPARMDDLESAIYYSAWNQCIAQIIKRYDVGLYHINDYHGALAPLHLLPNVIPCCLSLHNAEFQGLWPMRTLKERDEVCSVFNIDSIIATKYVQFGEVFNLLHAGVSYLRIHQRGFGAVGVSKKYGKRSFARYPIFWGLSRIGSLPNPDPTDTGELERNATTDNQYVVANEEFESKRPALKRQAQVWAGLDPNPDAELFVFVGRWSMQKGIDLIADVFPSVLESNSKVQLICVGPIIDLYGRFAALKLEKMMKLYPGRVHSKPQFTALPPYIFSGSEFALIPSRDEPFGLVAVEFGRKGALGVGARVGGLGQMPGWWYSIESMTSKHLVQQFKMAIYEALNSSTHTRSLMRARSALQRFPVAQWVEDLDTLQTSSIKFSKDEIDPAVPRSPLTTKLRIILSGNSTAHNNQFASPSGLSQQPVNLHVPGAPEAVSGPWTPPDIKTSPLGLMPTSVSSPHDSHSRSRLTSPTSAYEDNILPPPAIFTTEGNRDSKVLNLEIRRLSTLSYDSVAGNRKDFALQKVDPSFTDATGAFSRAFERKLEMLGGKSSENLLCIEENLVKSEKEFFNMYRDAKMGFSHVCNSRAASPAPSGPQTPTGSYFDYSAHGSIASDGSDELINGTEEFVLGKDYKPPTGLKRFLLYKIGDWPIYAIYLAFGQIIAANSYQITLLIGEIGQTAEQLYIIASIYAVSSLMWWFVFRKLKSVYVLSVPFAFYGLAFFLIALAPLTKTTARGWIQNIATGIYAAASSSGSLYFALNFGDEGMSEVHCRKSVTNISRWCPNQIMGPSSLFSARYTTTLHQRSLVLGCFSGHAFQHRHCCIKRPRI